MIIETKLMSLDEIIAHAKELTEDEWASYQLGQRASSAEIAKLAVVAGCSVRRSGNTVVVHKTHK